MPLDAQPLEPRHITALRHLHLRLRGDGQAVAVRPLKGLVPTLSVAPSDTVGDIARRLQEAAGLGYHIAFKTGTSKFLQDASTLADCYGEKLIPWESAVRLSALRADITLRFHTGNTITLRAIAARARVRELKQLIEQVEGIPPEEQRLLWCGRELEDGRCLRDYRVLPQLHEPTLHLALR
ncbi:hypothetical protein JKP88DRAFT_157811, partial [Tribonema minus]